MNQELKFRINRVSCIRFALGWSQSQFAKALEVSPSTVSCLERGVVDESRKLRSRIDALKVRNHEPISYCAEKMAELENEVIDEK